MLCTNIVSNYRVSSVYRMRLTRFQSFFILIISFDNIKSVISSIQLYFYKRRECFSIVFHMKVFRLTQFTWIAPTPFMSRFSNMIQTLSFAETNLSFLHSRSLRCIVSNITLSLYFFSAYRWLIIWIIFDFLIIDTAVSRLIAFAYFSSSAKASSYLKCMN